MCSAVLLALVLAMDARDVAGRVALWSLSMPLLGLLALFAAPDLPLLVLWTTSILVARRLPTQPSLAHWLTFGALVGATFWFKLTGVLLAAGLVLWSLVAPARRRWWRARGPWMAVFVAVCVSAPTWAWNVLHDFPTVRFHAVGRHQHAVSLLDGLGVWLAAHAVLLLPFVPWALRRPVAGRSDALWWSLPTFGVFTVAALVTPSKLHWWAPAWVAWLPPASRGASRRTVLAATVMGFAAQFVVVLQAAWHPIPLSVDVTQEMEGWDGLVVWLRQTHPEARVWLTTRYQTASQLAWAARAGPPVDIRRIGGRADQLSLWNLDTMPSSGPFLLVCAPHLPCTPRDVPAVLCAPDAETPTILDEGRAVRTFQVWTCTERSTEE